MTTKTMFSRRGLLCAGAAVTLAPRISLGAQSPRTLALLNLHTNERCSVVYHAAGDYLPDGLAQLNQVLRDWRSGEAHAMAPALLDFLHALKTQLDCRGDLHIISGYRSPKTNAMLRKNNGGVARRSLHMRGMALDVRLPGQPLAKVRDAAIELQRGGVGYYARSNFLHLDVGRVRRWG